MSPDDKIAVLRKIFSSDWAVVCKYRGDKIASVLVIENLGPLAAAYA